MAKACFLLLALLVLVAIGQVQPSETQRKVKHAAERLEFLHRMVLSMIRDFESSLDFDGRAQLRNNFLVSSCFSDSIQAPSSFEEIQKSNDLKVLLVSYRLLVSWGAPSQAFSGTFTNSLKPDAIADRLADLKFGLHSIITGLSGQSAVEDYLATSAIVDQSYVDNPDTPEKLYSLMSCFQRDIHRVGTYLSVVHCRTSPKDCLP